MYMIYHKVDKQKVPFVETLLLFVVVIVVLVVVGP
jgi:hypothetical protein